MSTFVVLLVALLVVVQSSTPRISSLSQNYSQKQWVYNGNVCIWDVVDSSFVNGVWTYSGTSQSNDPYFALQNDPTCNTKSSSASLFLYLSLYSIWTISPILDSINSTEYEGICASNTVFSPDECAGKWQIPYGTIQSSVAVSLTACPEVTCGTLHVDFGTFLENDPCVGEFTHVGTNLFQRGKFDMYLYFNPSMLRWICGPKSGTPNKCFPLDTYNGYAVHKSWYNAHQLKGNGDKITIPWNNDYTATIKCPSTGYHLVFKYNILIIIFNILYSFLL